MVNKSERSKTRFYWYFGLFAETISKVIFGNSFVFIYHSRCCFWLYSFRSTILLLTSLLLFCKSINLNTYAYTLQQIQFSPCWYYSITWKNSLVFSRYRQLKGNILHGLDSITTIYKIKTYFTRKRLKSCNLSIQSRPC